MTHQSPKDWLLIFLGIACLLAATVFLNGYLGYEDLRLAHSIWFDPDAQRFIAIMSLFFAFNGVILLWLGIQSASPKTVRE